MTWRVAYRLKGEDEDSFLDCPGPGDAHDSADELWREDRHRILVRLAVEESVGDEWIERSAYDCR